MRDQITGNGEADHAARTDLVGQVRIDHGDHCAFGIEHRPAGIAELNVRVRQKHFGNFHTDVIVKFGNTVERSGHTGRNRVGLAGWRTEHNQFLSRQNVFGIPEAQGGWGRDLIDFQNGDVNALVYRFN